MFFCENFSKPQKTLYFDISICYNKLDMLYTGDEFEFTGSFYGKNEK